MKLSNLGLRYSMVSMVAILFISLMMTGKLYAQGLDGDGDGGDDPPPVEDVVYDVTVASGASGNASEFPVQYTLEYENGEQETVSIAAEGRQEFVAQGVRGAVVAIWWFGIRFPIGVDVGCTAPDAFGGCWCLCVKWLDVTWFPWQIRPVFILYYDPCCR